MQQLNRKFKQRGVNRLARAQANEDGDKVE